jgi:hypothetical protein
LAQPAPAFNYNPVTNVMFVDLCPLQPNSQVEVIDVGNLLDFPGQIQARIDRANKIFYGLTIQNYSGFRRKVIWRFHIWSVNRALDRLVLRMQVYLGLEYRRPIALSC